jgi:hypothetical protein
MTPRKTQPAKKGLPHKKDNKKGHPYKKDKKKAKEQPPRLQCSLCSMKNFTDNSVAEGSSCPKAFDNKACKGKIVCK